MSIIRNVTIETHNSLISRILWDEQLPITGYWTRNRQDFSSSLESQRAAGAKARALKVAVIKGGGVS
jgi:hypothetical protein